MAPSPPPPDRPDGPRQSPRFVTGRLVAGRYEILDRIGEGGTAEVFRARDHRLDRIVAVKVLRPQYGQDPDARARFAVEARSAAALAVSNIVPVYDFGAADDGALFIVMRLIDGPSLRRVLSERGSLPAGEAVEIARQVAQALAAAHAHGLIHRDVKPGNILLDPDGTAHLTDFGIVKALAGADDLTRTGMTFGTAAYLSPEQATGGTVGPRTDLYALGVVLYEALAGRPPFSGDDPLTVSYRHAHEAPPPLASLVSGVDADLARLVMHCLEKDQELRPASADEVAERLAEIASRIASSRPAAAAVGGLAAAIPERPFDAGLREPEKETVLMTTVTPPAAAPAAAAAVPAWSPPAAPPSAPPWSPQSAPAHGPPMHAGLAPAGRAPRTSRPTRRAGTAFGTTIVLLAIAFVVIAGTVIALPMLLPAGDDGGIADASATRRPRRTEPPSQPAVVAPVVTPSPSTPGPTGTATSEPSPPVIEPPSATPVPSPERTRRPRPEPTPDPTPEPTAAPPEPTPPPIETVRARIPDRWFEGDYDGEGSGRYHGRSASWVYGQGTPYHTMTARFRLEHSGQIVRRASLEIVGLDGDDPAKHTIRIVLNGVTIHEGPNPLPNDECCGPSGPGNWGSAVFRFPGDVVRRNNSLSVTNLEPGDCTSCPNYVMVDYGVLEYRVQP